MSSVASERVEEALRYAKGQMPETAICDVHIDIDRDEDFVVVFENGSGSKYGVYVVLQDVEDMGWKECQALADVMRLSSRGRKVDNAAFRSVITQMERKYGKTEGPAERNDRLCAGVFPGPGNLTEEEEDDTIISTGMSFNNRNDLVFDSCTSAGKSYRMVLELTGTDKGLYEKDCEAMIDILGMLETGDCVHESKFWAFGYILRKKYNIVKSEDIDGVCTLSILASSVENLDPIDTVLEEAFQEEAAKQLVQVAGALAELNDASPYPGISFTREISEGGQGKVFAGVRQGKEVAVKVFCADEGEESYAVESFKTELRLLLKMSRHENVVSVLDFFETPQPALVMSLIDGEDLMDYLHRNGGLPIEEGRRLAVAIADGLCHLHRHGIIHRDLKSSNILRRSDGTPIIIDLGLGGFLERSKGGGALGMAQLMAPVSNTHVSAQTAYVKGTTMWMAPEMISQNSWSDKTDVYGFGMIMWELFSGKTPFVPDDGRPRTHLQIMLDIAQGKRPDMRPVEHIDDDLKNIMQMCWEQSPKRRPSMRRVFDMLNGNDPEAIFNSIDADNDGSLDFGEFVNFLQKYAPGKVQVSEMHVLFTAIDDDNSGRIELDEFLSFWGQVEIHGLATAVKLGARKDLASTNF